jgi:flagellar hook-associated protein 3 FlgL
MKTSFVSTSAISQALRYQITRAQAELTQRQTEATTGKVADADIALGARVSQSVSLDSNILHLQGIIDSNSLAANRLSATQDALTQMTDVVQKFLSTLTASVSGVENTSVMQSEATGTVNALTSLLNANMNGEYLFAGINTDVKPVNDFSDPASANRVAFEQAFSTFFGFPTTDPQAANITAAQMTTFLDTEVEPQFLGTGWEGNWSNAADQTIVSRISPNDTAETSITADGDGMRKLMMAAASISAMLDGPLSKEAQNVLYERAISLVGAGVADVANVEGEVGVVQNRVSDASDRLSAQIDLSKRFLQTLEGVDPYEAATRVNDLLTQIETSYALTARIQQLSLIKYLP